MSGCGMPVSGGIDGGSGASGSSATRRMYGMEECLRSPPALKDFSVSQTSFMRQCYRLGCAYFTGISRLTDGAYVCMYIQTRARSD